MISGGAYLPLPEQLAGSKEPRLSRRLSVYHELAFEGLRRGWIGAYVWIGEITPGAGVRSAPNAEALGLWL